MSILYFLIVFFTAFAFSFMLVPIILKIAHSKKLYDHPDQLQSNDIHILPKNLENTKPRRIHTKPIPRLGGIALVFGFFMSLIIWTMPSNIGIFYLCSFILFLTGLIDDLKSLPAKLKLGIQFCLAAITVLSTQLNLKSLYITENIHFQIPFILGIFISVFIIIGAINAINMIDGLDGLAGGVTLIAFSLLSYLHFLNTNNVHLIIFYSLPIIGSILGFLKYNTYPSSIFMGDCGSNWLGFMIGVFLLLIANQATIIEKNQVLILTQTNLSTHALPFLSIIMCVSIPIFDTAHVIFLRFMEGKNPMNADKKHIHHALMKIGFTHSQSVTAVYFLMMLFGLLGILPVAYPQYHFGWTPIFGIILLLFCIYFTQKLNAGFILNLLNYKKVIHSKKIFGSRINFILNFWENLNRYTIYILLFITPVFAGVVPKQLGYMAASMCLVLIITIFIKKNFTFFESLVITFATTILLIANNANPIWIELLGVKYQLQNIYNGLFIWLFISTILFFIITFKRRYLYIAPTDFLLIILPLILLLLPKEIQDQYRLNIIALRSLVIFAALRTIDKRQSKFFYKIHIICILALAWVALTSVFALRLVY